MGEQMKATDEQMKAADEQMKVMLQTIRLEMQEQVKAEMQEQVNTMLQTIRLEMKEQVDAQRFYVSQRYALKGATHEDLNKTAARLTRQCNAKIEEVTLRLVEKDKMLEEKELALTVLKTKTATQERELKEWKSWWTNQRN